MPLWTLTSPPKWAPTAVQSDTGWKNATTGEHYVAIGKLNTVKGVPFITGVVLADATLVTAEVLTLTVTFNEAVTVTGTPRIAVIINGTTRQVSYTSTGSTATAKKFVYTIVGGDVATATQVTCASVIALNGGTLKGATLNNARLTLKAPTPAFTTVTVN